MARVPAILLFRGPLGGALQGQGAGSISSRPHTVVSIGSGLGCLIFDGRRCPVLSADYLASLALEVRNTVMGLT